MTNPRLMRTQALLGTQAIQNLQNSTVMIVGIGAVGGYALEALARAGVGKLILVDFDCFDETNINRQILALTSTLGQKKIEAAKNRVAEINPNCNVVLEDVFVNSSNIDILLKHSPGYVVDAIDSIKSKCELMAALQKNNIPFVSSMGAALKTDISRVKIAPLSATRNCPMAKVVRQNLKRQGSDITKVMCVFSDEQTNLPDTAIVKTPNKTKNILGSLPTVTAVFGLMMAHKVILDLAKGR